MKCGGGPYDTWIDQPTGCEPTCENINTQYKSPVSIFNIIYRNSIFYSECFNRRLIFFLLGFQSSYSSCRCEIGTVRRADGFCVVPNDCDNTSTGVKFYYLIIIMTIIYHDIPQLSYLLQ